MEINTFTAKVIDRKQLTEDVILLSFQCPENFTFKAGQYVSVKVENESETKRRSYSILNPPSQKGQLDLCIKIVEGGFASSIFDNAQVGNSFEFKGPLGHFIFDEEDNSPTICLVGTGTGVTPLYSMLMEFLPSMPEKKFVLLFGVRHQKGLFLHDKFQQLAKQYPNFEYIPMLSRDEWEGKQGRVQQHLPEDCSDTTFYICGLKEMVLETKELLINKQVEPKNIRFERYN
ncbi:MAG: FAD-binding oxidoreductase [archaeon]|nr:FAD-binding oxidoreductase [archaeon]